MLVPAGLYMGCCLVLTQQQASLKSPTEPLSNFGIQPAYPHKHALKMKKMPLHMLLTACPCRQHEPLGHTHWW